MRKTKKTRIRRRENRISILQKLKTKLAQSSHEGERFRLIEKIRKISLSNRYIPSFGSQKDKETEIFPDNT
jgi:hypothetical protein